MDDKELEKQYELTVINPSGNVWDSAASCTPPVEVVDGKSCVIRPSGRKKVCIMGFSGSSREKAPFYDEAYEVWGLNQLYRHIPRADRWFDIHENYDEHVVEGTDHVGWLRSCKIPVYMNEHHEQFPTSVRYPIETMMDFFGEQHLKPLDYYTSTVAYMIALAIVEEFTTIAVYGVDMVAGTEYADQKPCVEYYLGVAAGRGITIELPNNTALLTQHHRYGYEKPKKGFVTTEEFLIRKKAIDDKRKELTIQLAILDGAAQEDAYWANVHNLRERGADIVVEAT